MSSQILTLQNFDKSKDILPRTVLQAIADANGNYLDSGLAASDINQLKGKTVLATDSTAGSGNLGKYDPNGKIIDSEIEAAKVAPLADALSVVDGALCVTFVVGE